MSNKLKIMIIDDDELYVYLSKKIAERTGFIEVSSVFYNANEALLYLEKNAEAVDQLPDIILLDIFMPVMDGWQFLEEYKNIRNRLAKVISLYISSSSISPYEIEKAKLDPVITDYITKPLNSTAFNNILTEYKIKQNSFCGIKSNYIGELQ